MMRITRLFYVLHESFLNLYDIWFLNAPNNSTRYPSIGIKKRETSGENCVFLFEIEFGFFKC